jgi:L,D-peptidoglycan transpeptidase YkuD (ErfK/YbiS/YcfS/YnhG family)
VAALGVGLGSGGGSFTFGTGFGLSPNPGYRLGWFDVGPTDYWVEDPASPVYNTHQQGPADESQAPWGHFERLIDQPVAYQYAALINFDVPASGGRGSGIFLHASKGAATAGCVSLPVGELITALRWIDQGTRIIMGPDSEIRKL